MDVAVSYTLTAGCTAWHLMDWWWLKAQEASLQMKLTPCEVAVPCMITQYSNPDVRQQVDQGYGYTIMYIGVFKIGHNYRIGIF